MLAPASWKLEAGSWKREATVFPAHGDLAAQAEAIRWYHSIDLGGGIVTRGIDDTPLRLARLDLPRSFAGLTVLDIGAWDGFFSFEAERRGASRVVAADYYSWHGSGWGSKAGFDPGRELNGDPTNWWAPNVPALHGMLRDVGFTEVRSVTPQPSAIYRAARAVSHRLQGKNSLAKAYRQDRAVVQGTEVDSRQS